MILIAMLQTEYVDKYVDWMLNKSIANAFDAFQRGFWTVVSTSFMALFQPEEIEYLIRGSAEVSLFIQR